MFDSTWTIHIIMYHIQRIHLKFILIICREISPFVRICWKFNKFTIYIYGYTIISFLWCIYFFYYTHTYIYMFTHVDRYILCYINTLFSVTDFFSWELHLYLLNMCFFTLFFFTRQKFSISHLPSIVLDDFIQSSL